MFSGVLAPFVVGADSISARKPIFYNAGGYGIRPYGISILFLQTRKSRCSAEDFRGATGMFAMHISRGREAASPHRQVQTLIYRCIYIRSKEKTSVFSRGFRIAL